jgi:glycosyltransferase involved in cell wall biosynthesis
MKDSKNKPDGPCLCFVGSMTGRHPGHITQQGQVVSDLFKRSGYGVNSVSAYLNRYRRLLDIVVSLIRYRKQTDLVILEVYGGLSFVVEDIASWLGCRLGLRVIMWLHGGALPEFMARFPRWTTRVLRRADRVVVPSEFLSRTVEAHGFAAQIIPNVIDLPEYPYLQRQKVRPRLFWMRSFDDLWNPGMAVRVLDRVRAKFPDATLVMAGRNKGNQPEVERLVSSLGLADRVRFAGFLDMEGKAREGGRSDIFINTNRIDNMPVAIIEACAMGLPVISTNVGGIPNLLTDGQNALVVPDDDDAAMAEAVIALVSDSELSERLSRNGRRLAEQFSWQQVRPQWEGLFAQLVAGTSEGVRAEGNQASEQARGSSKMMETF